MRKCIQLRIRVPTDIPIPMVYPPYTPKCVNIDIMMTRLESAEVVNDYDSYYRFSVSVVLYCIRQNICDIR